MLANTSREIPMKSFVKWLVATAIFAALQGAGVLYLVNYQAAQLRGALTLVLLVHMAALLLFFIGGIYWVNVFPRKPASPGHLAVFHAMIGTIGGASAIGAATFFTMVPNTLLIVYLLGLSFFSLVWALLRSAGITYTIEHLPGGQVRVTQNP